MNNTWWVKEDELDARQKAVMDLPLETSHLIIGPPGSGKTNLLLLRASQMVRSGKPNILILVFTRTLMEFIATGGDQYAFEVEKIKTLNNWTKQFLREYGVTAIDDDDFDTQRLGRITQIKSLIANQSLSKIYQAIVLDEAQDYLKEELDMFAELGEVVFAAADSRQRIYVNGEKDATALKVRFGDSVYTLKYHYRNGARICQVADELGKGWKDYEPLMRRSNYDEKQYPSSVAIMKSGALHSQVADAVATLQLQLKAYPNEHLGLLCPTRKTLKLVAEAMRASHLSQKVIVQSSADGYVEFDPSKPICVCTAHGAKEPLIKAE